MSNFREMAPQWLQNGCSKKFQILKNMNMLYIILKHVVWRFRIYNYFREIFKFRDFMNTLRNFAKSVLAHIFAKLEYLKVINYIFQISRPRASKWYITCSYFKSLKFFRTAVLESLRSHFEKIAHKIAKSKYFPNI